MWIRGNHKKRYTAPSAWHLWGSSGLAPKYVEPYVWLTVDGKTFPKKEAADTVKSIDGYTWWDAEVERREELPTKGKICGKCLTRYLSEDRISKQSD